MFNLMTVTQKPTGKEANSNFDGSPMCTPISTPRCKSHGTPIDTPDFKSNETQMTTTSFKFNSRPLGTLLGTPLGTPLGTSLGTQLGRPLGTPISTPKKHDVFCNIDPKQVRDKL